MHTKRKWMSVSVLCWHNRTHWRAEQKHCYGRWFITFAHRLWWRINKRAPRCRSAENSHRLRTKKKQKPSANQLLGKKRGMLILHVLLTSLQCSVSLTHAICLDLTKIHRQTLIKTSNIFIIFASKSGVQTCESSCECARNGALIVILANKNAAGKREKQVNFLTTVFTVHEGHQSYERIHNIRYAKVRANAEANVLIIIFTTN